MFHRGGKVVAEIMLCNRSRGHCGVDVEKEVYGWELQGSMCLLLGGEPPWDGTDIDKRI